MPIAAGTIQERVFFIMFRHVRFGFALVLLGLVLDGLCPAKPTIESTLDIEKLKPKGKTYEATVPDTLDLVDKANLAINCMVGNIMPEKEYSVAQGFEMVDGKAWISSITWNIQQK